MAYYHCDYPIVYYHTVYEVDTFNRAEINDMPFRDWSWWDLVVSSPLDEVDVGSKYAWLRAHEDHPVAAVLDLGVFMAGPPKPAGWGLRLQQMLDED